MSYRLTDDALAGFDEIATRHRITTTALLEAFGRLCANSDPDLSDVLTLASEIDRERRSRR